jgi:hypothetical protein
MRRRRALARRRAAYDGIRYDDRMASESSIRRALERGSQPGPEGSVVDSVDLGQEHRQMGSAGDRHRRSESVISIQVGNATLDGPA